MRVVLATHSFRNVAGSETYLLTVAEHLQRLGHEVTIHAVETGAMSDLAVARGIPVAGSETTTYIYAGDRWQDPDLISSKYIWLPLVVNGTKLTMSNATQWSLSLGTGRNN